VILLKVGASSSPLVSEALGRRIPPDRRSEHEGARLLLLDQIRGQMDYPATLDAVRTLSHSWDYNCAKLIEDMANGSAVIQMLQYEIPGILAVNPEGGKVARASAVSPLLEAGNVYLPHPQNAPWVQAFIDECAMFPNGAHDDQIDAMTQALLRWHTQERVVYVDAEDLLRDVQIPMISLY
jgi:predicted phage terminase large subunit-like protein